MSRIGKKSIKLPSGVDVKITGQLVTVKGSKGELKDTLPACLSVKVEEGMLYVEAADLERETKALWGLHRSLIANMITGVSEGFKIRLELVGVGYRFKINGKKLNLELGFSHPLDLDVPAGLELKQDEKNKNILEVSGFDKQVVGQFCAEIRKFRPPEPYKGKGIKYEGEKIARKAGKAAGAK